MWTREHDDEGGLGKPLPVGIGGSLPVFQRGGLLQDAVFDDRDVRGREASIDVAARTVSQTATTVGGEGARRTAACGRP
jgi:hypothetical protein